MGEGNGHGSRGSGRTLTEESRAAWGSGGGDFDRIQDYHLMEFVYEQVDKLLDYPPLFVVHGIEGTVNARLVLDDQGACDWRDSSISSVQPYLRAYVLDVMKKTCRQNFERYLAGRTRTNVDLSFRFATLRQAKP